MTGGNYLTKVREQYENYPYPWRDPEDEKKRLVWTQLDALSKINHYCFRGKRDFRKGFRVLIAGGGTGDSSIFMAEQLREMNGEVVHLDISSASTNIAKKRARIRGLKNIHWQQGSLLDIAELKLGKFDFINCSGVLHHLESPEEGLKALRGVLNDGGAMGLMVYGQYGRTGVYQMQELMKLINEDEEDMRVQLERTKKILRSLPKTNWFKLAEYLFADIKKGDEIEIYDAFLHSQDRAYTVQQLYDLVEACGLYFVDFAQNNAAYELNVFVKDAQMQRRFAEMPVRKRQAAAEILAGIHKKHTFYVSTERNTVADFEQNMIPFFHFCDNDSAKKLLEPVWDKPIGQVATIGCQEQGRAAAHLWLTEYTKAILKHFDGYNSLGKIVELAKTDAQFSEEHWQEDEIREDLKRIYNLFHLVDFVMLRDSSLPALKTYEQMQRSVAVKYNQDNQKQ